jgi:hypothetical protein
MGFQLRHEAGADRLIEPPEIVERQHPPVVHLGEHVEIPRPAGQAQPAGPVDREGRAATGGGGDEGEAEERVHARSMLRCSVACKP